MPFPLRDGSDDPANANARTSAHIDRLQEELESILASETEWRAVVETLPQIVWIARPDGHHVYFNQLWMDFTGLSLKESLGDGWNPPFHPEERPLARRLWAEATRTGEPYEIEYRLRRRDGVYCWMLGRARPLRDKTGEIVKWFGTCTDIGDLKTALEDAVELRAELRRSNGQLAAFAGQVSHDLRNPLTSVSLALQMIGEAIEAEEPGKGGADVGWLVQRAIGGSQRMLRLIDDLLSFARLGGEIVRVRVDLASVVDDLLVDLEVALIGAKVEVRDLPTVTGDPVLLRAVMQNLVANAAKFTRVGETADMVVDGSRCADGWRIHVSDHGPGIAENDRERVFEPLARVDEAVEGSGIGLTTCRRIVEAHGGRIGLATSPWGGTTAWFELPD
jgi:PAS domain S-box-containing protein